MFSPAPVQFFWQRKIVPGLSRHWYALSERATVRALYL
jgi:hypothetical protein